MPPRNRPTPSFTGLLPASPRASATARAASAKTNTRCELVLRRELWSRGLRYRLHCKELPGRPDITFPRQRIAVFCDGDFWHGRDLAARLDRLSRGHNASYWTSKVQRNVERDRRHTQALKELGWTVLRFWETDILKDARPIVSRIANALRQRAHPNTPPLQSSSSGTSRAGMSAERSD